MATWPDVAPSYGYEETEDWRTQVLRGQGTRQVIEELQEPLVSVVLKYSLRPDGKLAAVRAFIRARRGPAEPFDFFSCNPWGVYSSLALGTGDGVTATFVVPLKAPIPVGLVSDPPQPDAWSYARVYVDGVMQGYGSAWDLATPDAIGRARITFRPGSVPAAGSAVTIDGVGRRYYRMAISNPGTRVQVPRFKTTALQVEMEEDRTP